jgi:hypothetical protein
VYGWRFLLQAVCRTATVTRLVSEKEEKNGRAMAASEEAGKLYGEAMLINTERIN